MGIKIKGADNVCEDMAYVFIESSKEKNEVCLCYEDDEGQKWYIATLCSKGLFLAGGVPDNVFATEKDEYGEEYIVVTKD